MKLRIVLILEGIALLSSLFWAICWLNDPSGPYEPPFAFSGLVLIFTEFYRRTTKAKTASPPNPKDVELYESLIGLLPSNDFIRFYREHDFLAAFDRRYVEPLYAFVGTWDDAEHEFIDAELEASRASLYEAAHNLMMAITKNTVPNHRGLLSVKPDHLEGSPTPDWVKLDAVEINNLSPAFVQQHEELVRLGRSKLYA